MAKRADSKMIVGLDIGTSKVVAIVGAAASGPLLPTITNFSPCKTLVRRARNRARAT